MRTLSVVAGLAMILTSSAGLAADRCKSLTEADFQRYFSCFNARDMACVAAFYTPDVTLSKGPNWPEVRGPADIVAFYRDVADHGLREQMTVHRIVVGKTDVAIDLEAHFTATKDWPDFGARPVRAGDDWRIRGVLFYRLTCGRISDIRPAGRIAAPAR